MSFDKKKFLSTKMQARTEGVTVRALSDWFDKGEKAIWEVRGLTHSELAFAESSSDRNKNVDTIIQAMSGSDTEKVSAMKKIMGMEDGEVPHDTAKRMQMLVTGSVIPKIELEVAVKLATTFPIEFSILTNKIVELTGKGQLVALGKQKPSGKSN